MKKSVRWTFVAVAVMIVLPFLYFLWPGVFAFAVIACIVLLKVKLPTIKGQFGEWQVIRLLGKLGEQYKVFNDLYIPKEGGGTAQVDHIITSPYGIFVVETKNYAGWIFGSEHQAQWTQVIYKRKEKLYNPIRQNYGHVMSLKSYLGTGDLQIFHSIVAFSSQSTFKFKEDFNSAAVIQFPELAATIKEKRIPLIGKNELDGINKRLEKLAILDKKEIKRIKREHLHVLKSSKAVKINSQPRKAAAKPVKSAVRKPQSDSTDGITKLCLKCGSVMKLKKGRYGLFFGCSNYPECRHTEKSPVNS